MEEEANVLATHFSLDRMLSRTERGKLNRARTQGLLLLAVVALPYVSAYCERGYTKDLNG